MQLANPQIKGYILDGVVSNSGSKRNQKLSFADWDVNMNEVGQKFLNEYRMWFGSSSSNSKITPSLMPSVLAELDKDVDGTVNECNAFLVKRYGKL
ncbi:Aste57867_6605 [Aphanomyces stellatus]|uniref:Aste57867_6605 protein n=1 Tax=Aphanomyces stellatus TaxID=120398 RepID=A0A485KFL7_9STRA|nr:hypothetical protein As57867_006587 [Aphanomyces stellatus]VFT83583.1 Aste57867_6605 [Aphanomyces stellatus]